MCPEHTAGHRFTRDACDNEEETKVLGRCHKTERTFHFAVVVPQQHGL